MELTKEQMDAKIEEHTVRMTYKVEYNPILDLMKVFTEKGTPVSVIEGYNKVKNTMNPLLFGMNMDEYPEQDTEEPTLEVKQLKAKVI